jgi:hypothetical protein
MSSIQSVAIPTTIPDMHIEQMCFSKQSKHSLNAKEQHFSFQSNVKKGSSLRRCNFGRN